MSHEFIPQQIIKQKKGWPEEGFPQVIGKTGAFESIVGGVAVLHLLVMITWNSLVCAMLYLDPFTVPRWLNWLVFNLNWSVPILWVIGVVPIILFWLQICMYEMYDGERGWMVCLNKRLDSLKQAKERSGVKSQSRKKRRAVARIRQRENVEEGRNHEQRFHQLPRKGNPPTTKH